MLTGSRRADLELRVRYDRDVALAPPRSVEEIGSLPAALDAAVSPGTLRRDRAHCRHLHGDDGAAGDRPTTWRRAGIAALSPARPMTQIRGLRIVHLFPDVLRVYGDGGNVMTLVRRAEARSIATSVERVRVGADRFPPADLLFIGGGQDREQETVARELERLGSQLVDLVGEGAALLAVCGGYQNLGIRYLTSRGTELIGPGLFPVSTDASGVHDDWSVRSSRRCRSSSCRSAERPRARRGAA